MLNQHKADFLAANKKAKKTNRECFIEFAKDYLDKNYSNEGTKIKYNTVINSLQKYTKDVLGKDVLTFEDLRKIDFIGGYKKWVFKRQYHNRDSAVIKKTKTVFNYVIVIKTFVKKYNQLNPEKEEIKTIHYSDGVEDFDVVEPRMLYPDEIRKAASMHAVGDAVKAAYLRTDLLEKRGRLMNDSAKILDRPSARATAKVAPIRRKS